MARAAMKSPAPIGIEKRIQGDRLVVDTLIGPSVAGFGSWRSLRLVGVGSSGSLLSGGYRPGEHPPRRKRNPRCQESCHDISDQQVEDPRKEEEPGDWGVFTESGEGAPAEACEEGAVKGASLAPLLPAGTSSYCIANRAVPASSQEHDSVSVID